MTLRRKNMLVVLAHPDDESFPMGGTLAKYAAEGVEITLICATLGELGIPDMEPAQAVFIREKELKAAASSWGFTKYRPCVIGMAVCRMPIQNR
jgi:LmbE family N-acetylglucosaminyl deacetylase